jgi:hypothetical protein
MKAIVAFSRNSYIKGMTALSKRLTKSPANDVVVGQAGVPDDETASNTTGSSNSRQRNVAVWTSSDKNTLGSVVKFEANLASSGKGKAVPRSFELIVALAEDNDNEHKVALPLGVASLAISGDECRNGKSLKLDLPVLGLSAAAPLKGRNGKGIYDYPMIAISRKPKDLPRKRTALHRLFHRQRKTKLPSQLSRGAFARVYSMDSTGDAVLRIALEVYEKGSQLEKTFVSRRMNGEASISTNSLVRSPPRPSRVSTGVVPFDERTRKPSVEVPSDEEATLKSARSQEDTIHSKGTSVDASTMQDTKEDITFDATFEGTLDENTTEEGYREDHTYDGDHGSDAESDTFIANDDNVGFFTWNNPDEEKERNQDEEDDYTLSFEPKEGRELNETEEAEDEVSSIEFELFGRRIHIPFCASLPLMSRSGGDADSVTVSTKEKGDLLDIVNDIRDEMTFVTADFFGRSYRVPLCSALKPRDDDDTLTLQTERDTRVHSKRDIPVLCTDKICQPAPSSHDEVDVNETFSTVSETDGNDIEKGPTTVKDILNAKENVPSSPEKARETREQETPTNQKHSPEIRTDSSPTGIHDFPGAKRSASGAADARESATSKKNGSVSRALVDLFFKKEALQSRVNVTYEPYEHEYPQVIMPGDDTSVGELTANTHELNIASEAKILEHYKQKFHAEAKKTKSPSRVAIPVPVAFGGDGMCGGVSVKVTSSPIRVASGGSNSLMDFQRQRPKNENYFAEYDDFSLLPPSKAALTKGQPAAMSATPGPVSDSENSPLSYEPIEMTITGQQL